MLDILENVAETDPVVVPEQRAIIHEVLAEYGDMPGATMVVLSELQSRIGHISQPMQAYIAQKLRVPLSEVNGVVTFYSFFTTQPKGKYTIKFCMGTACYVGGMTQLIEKAQQLLGIKLDETTPDGLITLEACRCVGACSQAPVVAVGEDMHGRLRPNSLPRVIKKYQKMG